VPQIREGTDKRAGGITSNIALAHVAGVRVERPEWGCIQVVIDEKLTSALPGVGQSQYVVAKQFALKAEIKVVVSGSFEIVNHRKCVKRWHSGRISSI